MHTVTKATSKWNEINISKPQTVQFSYFNEFNKKNILFKPKVCLIRGISCNKVPLLVKYLQYSEYVTRKNRKWTKCQQRADERNHENELWIRRRKYSQTQHVPASERWRESRWRSRDVGSEAEINSDQLFILIKISICERLAKNSQVVNTSQHKPLYFSLASRRL